MSDLAVLNVRDAAQAAWDDHPGKVEQLVELGNCLRNKYGRTKELSDLEELIQVTQNAVERAPEDHPDRAMLLINLGVALGNRFERTGLKEDLEKSFQITQEAQRYLEPATEKDSPGKEVESPHTGMGALTILDIEKAFHIAQESVDTTRGKHVAQAQRLKNLRDGYLAEYDETGLSDLEEDIRIARANPDPTARIVDLGSGLRDRYDRIGAMADLEEAIQVAQDALDATSEDHPDWAERSQTLGTWLRDRFGRTGELADLDEAIKITRKAIDTRQDHPDRVAWLINLGNWLQARYRRTGGMADLEEAIQIARQVFDNTSADDKFWAKSLSGLATKLNDRYERTGAMSDLNEAIQIAREGLSGTPENHLNRLTWLNNLAIQILNRYRKTGGWIDLHEAIQLAQEQVNAMPKDHPYRASSFNSLGAMLSDRYDITGAMEDLESTIHNVRQAVNTTPENHPEQAKRQLFLGGLLRDRYKRVEAVSDLKESLSCYQSALRQSNAPTITRIYAGRAALQLYALVRDWEQAYEVSTIAVDLIPKLSSRSLENSDKQHMLSWVVGLTCDATAAALHLQKPPQDAVYLLEQGRGVLASSLEEMWVDISDLQRKHPELSDRFVHLREELRPSTGQYTSLMDDNYDSFSKAPSDRRSMADKELDQLIAEIRRRPDFKDFLLAPSKKDIQAGATRGPIAIINVSKYRCDALLIEQHQIRSLALPYLKSEDIEDRVKRGSLESSRVLSWLWDTVAHPVLDALGYSQPPRDETWPRMWWIPTGSLSKFPLHAAGRHNTVSGETVLDRVMSSYNSSIKAIINSRRCRVLEETPVEPNQALLVAMEDTPGHTRLRFAAREVEVIKSVCKSMAFDSNEPGRRKQDVISQLPHCRIFHFAGHGHTDDENPSQSHLLLEDWQTDPLTVTDLLEMNLRDRAPFLAYLSACGTGEIRNEIFLDESIHLITAYQLAGFRHIIGTLWEVNDESCVDMARITYEQMRDGGMTDESVCLGLHKATRELRGRWIMAENKRKSNRGAYPSEEEIDNSASGEARDTRFQRKATVMKESPLHWVPYVHYGV